VQVQRLPTRCGVNSDEGMLEVPEFGESVRVAQPGLLEVRGIDLAAGIPTAQPGDTIPHRGRKRVVDRAHVDEQRLAPGVRCFLAEQNGYRRRWITPGSVGVPVRARGLVSDSGHVRLHPDVRGDGRLKRRGFRDVRRSEGLRYLHQRDVVQRRARDQE